VQPSPAFPSQALTSNSPPREYSPPHSPLSTSLPQPASQPVCASCLTRNTFMLFPGRDGPHKSLTYRTQNKRVKAAFDEVGIDCTKVCHAFRHAISRHLDQLG
jgi:hypothetical protein